ncbi:phytoene/squalene synthase family protein [Paenibacillus alginolyticus]|uniref:Squalene/phytoene synthase family protein n=1 Tax=Paenibacillus alginolyticus TaxID=59839 RepID=A0ABT4GLK3_9BACL|nr:MULTISPECIES: phytoene/squalene synthase family protein [Paenibacillus]MCY9697076.1 squalene/phytoene synthase family protein [Paenibacillus alginolyticus]MEC0146433.1 phytoene/squalene synthase family protein [Paenibacillus alginolyticus]NRF91958.1 phytoene/squalene synthase family protein [Paenibacillus frigoriresistens]
MELATCLSQCEAMIQKGSSSFYNAFRYLPSPRREAVYVIYAFCRIIDDAVDEPDLSPFTIDEIESKFTHLEEADRHFIWPSLRWLFATFPVTKTPFFKQMEGQRRDFTLTHYDSMDQLEEYCYLVAGTVGEMLLPVLHDHPDKNIVEAGIWLGKAMQIVNIVRDVGEDQRRGRRYLPLDLFARHGYSEEDFQEGVIDERFRQLIQELDERSRSWFIRGMQGIETYAPQSAFSVELAASLYAAILDEVRAADYQVFTKRAIVGSLSKLKLYAEIKKKYMLLSEANERSAVSL